MSHFYHLPVHEDKKQRCQKAVDEERYAKSMNSCLSKRMLGTMVGITG